MPDTRLGFNGGRIYGLFSGALNLRITPPQPELANQVDYLDAHIIDKEIKNDWYWSGVCHQESGRIFVM